MQRAEVTIVANVVVNLIGVRLMRPIDADKLLECVEASMLNNTHRNGNAALCHVSEHRHFIETIVEQPTAFDVEKVIEKLQVLSDKADDDITVCEADACQYYDGYGDGLAKAIEIVKRGGRDD